MSARPFNTHSIHWKSQLKITLLNANKSVDKRPGKSVFYRLLFSLPGFPHGLVSELYAVYFVLLLLLLLYQGPKNVYMNL